MRDAAGNHSSRDRAAALEKVEAELQALDEEAIRSQGGVTGRGSASMLRSARALSLASTAAGLSAVAGVSLSLERLLHASHRATTPAAEREYVESLLYRIDVLRLLVEEASLPAALEAGAEGFIRDFEAAVAVLEGGQPGAGMAA